MARPLWPLSKTQAAKNCANPDPTVKRSSILFWELQHFDLKWHFSSHCNSYTEEVSEIILLPFDGKIPNCSGTVFIMFHLLIFWSLFIAMVTMENYRWGWAVRLKMSSVCIDENGSLFVPGKTYDEANYRRYISVYNQIVEDQMVAARRGLRRRPGYQDPPLREL